MRSKKLRAERKRLVDEAQALLPADGAMSAEVAAKFNELMNKADELKTQIDSIERVETAQAEMDERIEMRARNENRDPDQIRTEDAAQGRIFNQWMRRGTNGLAPDDQVVARARINTIDVQGAMSAVIGTEGGYLVPDGPMQTLEQALLAYGGMLQLASTIRTTGGNPIPIPTDNDTNNMGEIVGESKAVTEVEPVFGVVVLGAHMYSSKIVRVPIALLQDSAFDLESYLMGTNGKLAVRIARRINLDFTTGDGASKPKGVITAATLGRTGANGQTTSVIYDDLVKLEHSVDPSYRANARFMMQDNTLLAIKLLKDGQGRPLWNPGIAVKAPDTIDGFPYVINQQMPAMALSAKSIAFGDFSKYNIRAVSGAWLLRLSERYADQGQVAFLMFQRYDGNLVDAGTHPVKFYQNSAA